MSLHRTIMHFDVIASHYHALLNHINLLYQTYITSQYLTNRWPRAAHQPGSASLYTCAIPVQPLTVSIVHSDFCNNRTIDFTNDRCNRVSAKLLFYLIILLCLHKLYRRQFIGIISCKTSIVNKASQKKDATTCVRYRCRQPGTTKKCWSSRRAFILTSLYSMSIVNVWTTFE